MRVVRRTMAPVGDEQEQRAVAGVDQRIHVFGREQHNEEGGVFRSERSYGSFARTIPLPDGVITDRAEAKFENGVLEIIIPAPPEQVRRDLRVEIGARESNDGTRDDAGHRKSAAAGDRHEATPQGFGARASGDRNNPEQETAGRESDQPQTSSTT